MATRYSRYTDIFSYPWLGVQISGVDLRAWILTQRPAPPPSGRRYASDDKLVADAIEGINSGTWSNAHKAAKDLAERAEGTREAAIDRLGGKIRKALGN